ncbi:hypothetical protein BKA62DRAFT_620594 [Auriculariales sp. MPI-PUGE-AT-0066]|nr:hypothetical protein BKA62DRAFT_620594 [Auriculariales sp. MPI-PUGE-AT-0066]
MVHPLAQSTTLTEQGDKYRGAVVEDLQLPPAFALPEHEPILRAIDLAYERDFSFIPVLSRTRKPIGYIDVASLKSKFESGNTNPDDTIRSHMTRFDLSRKRADYTVITPMTGLADLEAFLLHALFALVTDDQRKFVLAVATSQDLENFVQRRGF